jgi:hypothetical protein
MATAIEHYQTAEQLLVDYKKAVERRQELHDIANGGERRLTQPEIDEQEKIWDFADDALTLAQIHATLAVTKYGALDFDKRDHS